MAEDETREGIGLTHLDQPVFDIDAGDGPAGVVTKRELVDYLDAMSDRIVPVLAGRPLSVIRARPGQPPFMQKNLPKYAPDWIETVSYWADRSKRTVRYPVCNDRRTLLWFANQRAIEFHPTLFRAGEEEQPSWLVLDIDPPEGCGFATVVRAAELVHGAVTEAGLHGAVKTSGAKGVHVFVPVRDASLETVAAATRALAARAERLDPELATTAFVRDERGGRVFLDATRAGGATVAAAYSPRARPGLPVSFPVEWDALSALDPHRTTVRTVPGILGDSDPWAELMPAPQVLADALVEEGRAIPVARVQAMHAGKRRAREARMQAEAEDGADA